MVVGQLRAVHHGLGQAGFGVLLLGVVEEPGRGQPRKGIEGALGPAQGGLGLPGEAQGPLGIPTVHRPNGETAGPDGLPAAGQGFFPGLVRGAELGPDRVTETGQLLGAPADGRFGQRAATRRSKPAGAALVSGRYRSFASRSTARLRRRTSITT